MPSRAMKRMSGFMKFAKGRGLPKKKADPNKDLELDSYVWADSPQSAKSKDSTAMLIEDEQEREMGETSL